MKDPRNADRFAPLRTWTYKHISPSPWRDSWDKPDDRNDFVRVSDERGCDLADGEGQGLAHFSSEDARHIATWDPATAQEVLSLLEEAAGWVWEKDPTTLEECNWSDRLHALLARVTP